MEYSSRGADAVTVGAMVALPKGLVRNIERLKEALTVPNGAFVRSARMGRTSNVEPYFICYEETPDSVLVPRNFDFSNHLLTSSNGAPQVEGPHRSRYRGTWPHRMEKRPRQPPAVDALNRQIGDKILALACGAGKTCVSLMALCEQPDRLPALIVVPTQVLMEQWEQRIKEHVPLGLAQVGHIQGPKCEYKKHPFTVGMLRSLATKDYPEELYRHFRTIVFDEVHKLGAPMFCKVAGRFVGERWGLSATHARSDGNDKVFKLHCGEVAYEDLKQDLSAKTYFVRTTTSANMRYFSYQGQVNTAKLSTYLSNDVERNALIAEYTRKALSKGRRILALGDRVEQLGHLVHVLRDVDAGLLIGPVKAAERAAALTKDAVFATAALAKDGLDRREFDTLLILAPSSDSAWLQQAYGRILRECVGKQDPRVVIFEDVEIDAMRNRCNRIRQWLASNKLEWRIVHNVQ